MAGNAKAELESHEAKGFEDLYFQELRQSEELDRTQMSMFNQIFAETEKLKTTANSVAHEQLPLLTSDIHYWTLQNLLLLKPNPVLYGMSTEMIRLVSKRKESIMLKCSTDNGIARITFFSDIKATDEDRDMNNLTLTVITDKSIQKIKFDLHLDKNTEDQKRFTEFFYSMRIADRLTYIWALVHGANQSVKSVKTEETEIPF